MDGSNIIDKQNLVCLETIPEFDRFTIIVMFLIMPDMILKTPEKQIVVENSIDHWGRNPNREDVLCKIVKFRKHGF